METDQGEVVKGVFYLLDMGNTQYGECQVCRFGDIRILIDAGHPKDLTGQPGFRSIPEQLESILGPAPHRFDLIVVTHCHDDHIGCMPELVGEGLVTAKWALVSDPGWGFGRNDDGNVDADFGIDDADPEVRGLVVALCEEDHSDLSDAALAEFIDAAASLPDRYDGMLAKLKADRTRIIRYQRDPIPADFLKAFASTGLEILGPSREQLEACGKALSSYVKTATRATRGRKNTDANISALSLYREFVGAISVHSTDMAGTSGPPKNNQSIVLAFGKPGARVLLAGDMQLADAQMGRDAANLMDALRADVKKAGPYEFVKALHHTSYNGQDEDVLEAWGYPAYIAHSGGRNDANHPDSGALTTLKKHSRDLQYARTDRNGIVKFTPGDGFTIEKGRTNDFTTNAVRDTEGEPTVASVGEVPTAASASSQGSADSILVIRLPYAATTLVVDGVKLEFSPGASPAAPRAPPRTVSQDRQATRPAMPPAATSAPMIALGGGRPLSNLLFVTNSRLLAANVGASEAGAVLTSIARSRNTILDLAPGSDALADVRARLISDGTFKGVVIVGGYDVVPAMRVDVLTPELRTALGENTYGDMDNFIVWSDDPYGDKAADGLPDLPVSRIPDGRDAALLMKAISAAPSSVADRYGIRNTRRQFAEGVWEQIRGDGNLMLCEPLLASDEEVREMSARDVYFMLHGSASDGRRFWGEQASRIAPAASPDSVPLPDSAQIEAIRASQIPKQIAGTVFAGCCWGALTVKDLAGDARADVVTPRVPEASFALTCLKSGALAFVGCTGSHYSPNDSGTYAGGPLQRAFWKHLGESTTSPAEALFRAKVDFVAGMPHGRTDLFELAVDRKILLEFTCLGLGW